MVHILKLSAIWQRWRHFIWASMWCVTFAFFRLSLSSRRAIWWTRNIFIDIKTCAVLIMLIMQMSSYITQRILKGRAILYRKWPVDSYCVDVSSGNHLMSLELNLPFFCFLWENFLQKICYCPGSAKNELLCMKESNCWFYVFKLVLFIHQY